MSETQKINLVRPDLVEMELCVLHRLLGRWCHNDVIKRRNKEWEKKLPAFRRAVSAGQGTGSKETSPREIVMSEYWVAVQAIRAAKQQDRRGKLDPARIRRHSLVFDVPLPNGGVRKFSRPFPAPKAWRIESRQPANLNWRTTSKTLARQIAAVRLGDTLRGVTAKTKRRKEGGHIRTWPFIAHRHLAAVFLDLCSINDRSWIMPLRENVFETLAESGYHHLLLYYLVQVAHRLRYPLVSEEHDPDEVRGLCAATREAYAQCHRPATAAD